ncbi:hypothetical protein [Idiomarina sp. HP20-50]|uniref:hypothetical protein n=1 Tax=Idiomarina sp. HP20-50 TaxID=3070813 RepID=UPI00294B259D|nr:hypothetical protein [Idiomarina sp. HP20-50]MDV6316431.1 hypothetical protein [Idiomarina sp. HP20-50]
MSSLLNWMKTLSAIPLALCILFVVFLPSILFAALIVGVFDLLFLDLIWMSWPTFWWILGTWVVTLFIALVSNADKIMFGTPR